MKYVIHKNGHVFSFKDGKYRPLRQHATQKGYLLATIQPNRIRQTKSVHRLVAKGYVPNPENKPQINHKNGLKNDNRSENLEWCTAKENILHAFSKGLRRSGNQGGSIHWVKRNNNWLGQIRHCGVNYRKQSVDRSQVETWLKNKIHELEG